MNTTTRRASIGDRITGRCVTMGTEYSGTVVAVYEPQRYSGDSELRYRLTDTGQFYSCGSRIEPVVHMI